MAQSRRCLSSNVESQHTEGQTNGIKTQIKVRKILLDQKGDTSLFAFTAQGKPHSVDKLTENVCSLIRNTTAKTSHVDFFSACVINPELLVGKRISHTWATDHGDQVFVGEVLAIIDTFSTLEYKVQYEGKDGPRYMSSTNF